MGESGAGMVPEGMWQALAGQVAPDAGVRPLAPGWDCDAWAIGGRIVVKRPRHTAAEGRLRREADLLRLIGPRVRMAVPRLHLVEGPPLWSWHVMLPGGPLLAAGYEALTLAQRGALADDLAQFLAEVHRIAVPGAGRVQSWAGVNDLAALVPLLPPGLRGVMGRLVGDYAALGPDPLGEVFGQFDGHGWNMAFDHGAGRLNGIYDFGDAGIGVRHRDFIYCGLTALDLMARVVEAYRGLTGLAVDMARVHVLSGAHRLWEWGQGDAADREWLTRNLWQWAAKG